ncbi:MAG: HD domain-containing protein [Syntrophobacteraceae bacterium]
MRFTGLHISRLLDAVRFAADRHRMQRRKDAEATPYVNHPIEVAELVWRVGAVRDIGVVIAALLHDVIEDTSTGPEEIEELFGGEVLSIVLEVTDDKSLPNTERKRLQIEHAPRLSPSAKLVKIADKICNARDVIASPPENWSSARRLEYLDWTAAVVEGLRGCNAALESMYDRLLREGREKYSSPSE